MDEKKKNIIAYFSYLIIAVIVISFAILIWPVYRQYKKHEEKLSSLREQAAIKTAECIRLNKEVHDLQHSPRAVEKVAREKFGLCRDGEIVMKYKDADTKTE